MGRYSGGWSRVTIDRKTRRLRISTSGVRAAAATTSAAALRYTIPSWSQWSSWIASGRSTRQVASMAQKLAEKIKHSGGRARIEGLPNADWVLLDADDVIVHLFRPEVRSFYNLERMWAFEGSGETGQA